MSSSSIYGPETALGPGSTGKQLTRGSPIRRALGDINVGTPERVGSLALGGSLVYLGVEKKGFLGALLGLTGAALVYRGATGHCPVYGATGMSSTKTPPASRHVHVRKSITVMMRPDEAFELFEDPSNLPRILRHLESVERLDERQSHWVASLPTGGRIEWDSEITEIVPGRLIIWRSMPGSDIDQRGRIEIIPVPGDRGTEIHLDLRYAPPIGAIGRAASRLLGSITDAIIGEDLRQLKALIETGEIPTIEGQPSGTRSRKIKAFQRVRGKLMKPFAGQKRDERRVES